MAIEEKQGRLNALHELLRRYDYIGTKIATGRATTTDYSAEIADMEAWAAEVNKLEVEIALEEQERSCS